MARRHSKRPPRSKQIPFLVALAVSDKFGNALSRTFAVWRVMLLAVLGPLALLASLFVSDSLTFFLIPFGIFAIPLAIALWLAIRWLDQRKAWPLLKDRRNIDFRVW
ncbi:hypothetical protein NA78x_001687 [Anatilimnocola sp. NA78]|uniref:hypothetical protein n=1 Tax=Anatilimnocola sp. NA78 TaxID=3415683 RepID=UPI003CE5844D